MTKVFVLIMTALALTLTGIAPAESADIFSVRCANNQDFVTSLYRSILVREPDAGGHRHWVAKLGEGSSREWVIEQFYNSAEYRKSGKDNRAYVTDLYHGVLGREPEAAGLNYWIAELHRGVSRNEVLRRFFDSQEYRGIVAGCRY